MLSTVDCCQPACCPETETVNIPGIPGENGEAGAAGENGASAFTVTLSDFVVPPADNTTPVTVEVADTSWMATGQPLFIPDGFFFIVAAIVDSTHVQVVYPAWEANISAGNTISSGSSVVPSGWQPAAPTGPSVDAVSKYGTGTAYTIDQTDITLNAAEVTFGTSGNQRVTLTTAGTWLLQARVRVDYLAATFPSTSRSIIFLLARQNNSPGNVANATTGLSTPISASALSYTAYILSFPPVQYVTALTSDVIRMMVSIDTLVGAGAVKVIEADIVATFLHP